MLVLSKRGSRLRCRRSSLCVSVAAISYLLLPQAVCPQADSPDQPFQISAASNVDENLFAIRVLANVYASWPDKNTSRKDLSKWLSHTRAFTSGMRGVILSRGLDSHIDAAYQNCLNYLSATAGYLAALDQIDGQESTQAGVDAFSSLWTGISKSSDANSWAKKVTSNENAANAGALVGLFSGLADYSQRSTTRKNAADAAIAEQQRRLEDVWNTTWAVTAGVARDLTARFGWARGEAGFDGFQSANISDALQRYPRDPFVKARYGNSLAAQNDAAQMQQAAYAYLQAAELVPADAAYNDFRFQFVSEAVLNSADAASLQAGAYGYSSRPSMAPYALRIARTYLAMVPRDSDGWGRLELARALAFSGRYGEALDAASTAYETNHNLVNSGVFCERYAALLSLNNRTELADQWLAQALKEGFNNITYLRQSPDFASVRYTQARAFANLTAVHWAWKIDWGMLNDDVIVENTSAFDLTNVAVQLHIRKGAQVWNRQIKCESIRAGGSCKAVNLVSIPGDAYDEGEAALSSDQGEGVAQ